MIGYPGRNIKEFRYDAYYLFLLKNKSLTDSESFHFVFSFLFACLEADNRFANV